MRLSSDARDGLGDLAPALLQERGGGSLATMVAGWTDRFPCDAPTATLASATAPGRTPMTDTDRFEALEIKIAHLERGLQELSDVVVRQQQDLDRLALRNQQLKEQLEDIRGETEDKKDPHEVPPHY
jgi:uncharacterized coiled-coil protein SlyX